jgi:hypothetical protein
VGGGLGVAVGVVLAIFALGPVLRYFFGEANVEPGGAYDIRGLRIEPLDGEIVSESGVAILSLEIHLSDSRDPFPLDASQWELEMEAGEPLAAASIEPAGQVEPGETVTVTLTFRLSGDDRRPDLLRLSDPRIRFEAAHLFDE